MALGRTTDGGSRKGISNKATRDVRAAIAQLAEANVEKLPGWLERVIARDPAKTADLFLRLLEYYVPKLARTEVASTGAEGEAIPVIRVVFVPPGDPAIAPPQRPALDLNS